MRLHALLPLVVLAAAAPSAAQETQTFRSQFGYSLELPAQWKRVPDGALAVVRPTRAMAARGGIYEAGYQVADAPWPAPPVLTVVSQALPRKVTVEEFAAEFTPEARDEAQKAMGERAGEIRMGMPGWDANDRIGWMWMDTGLDGGVRTTAFTAAMLNPTSDRMILLGYYDVKRGDEARIRAQVFAIARSLR